MGRLTLITRLALRDLRRRPAETVLLLLVLAAATTTLTLGLALYGVTRQPYEQTLAATDGPDIVASFLNLGLPKDITAATGVAALRDLARQPGVAASTGPLPFAWPVVRINGLRDGVLAIGRSQAPSAVDRPELTQGSWVRPGGVVIERSFAGALNARVGEHLTLNGRRFTVAGIAVSAANSPYPRAAFATSGGPYAAPDFGTMWLTTANAESLATPGLPLSYLTYLKLREPAAADAFEMRYSGGRYSVLGLSSWQDIAQADNNLVLVEQRELVFGSWLLGLLAVASVAVLVGGRMADRTRQVGLLKAVGGTPKLVTAVLMTENLALALAAAGVGLATGRLAAPLLANPGAGLLGTGGSPSLSLGSAGLVVVMALAVAVLATFGPALRAARTSTVAALADAAGAPRRVGWLIALSRRLPVPLLLGLRMAARRPRRLVLTAASVTITVSAVVAMMCVYGHFRAGGSGFSVLPDPRDERLDQVLLVLIVVLTMLAAVNAVFVTSAIALDTRRSAALLRAIGANSRQVAAGLSAALLLPGSIGAILGIPVGIALVAALSHGGGSLDIPSAWQLAAAVAVTVLVLAGLTAGPARAGARRSPAPILQSERS